LLYFGCLPGHRLTVNTLQLLRCFNFHCSEFQNEFYKLGALKTKLCENYVLSSTTHFLKDQSLPVCLFDKNSLKMICMEHWWNGSDRGRNTST